MFKMFFLSFAIFGFSETLDIAKVSEAMGHIIGKNLEDLGLDFDLEAVVKGLKEESEGKNSPLNEDECVQAIVLLQEKKMNSTTEEELQMIDVLSNGDQIDENHSFPTSDSAKHR
jgi:hypothetical protein